MIPEVDAKSFQATGDARAGTKEASFASSANISAIASASPFNAPWNSFRSAGYMVIVEILLRRAGECQYGNGGDAKPLEDKDESTGNDDSEELNIEAAMEIRKNEVDVVMLLNMASFVFGRMLVDGFTPSGPWSTKVLLQILDGPPATLAEAVKVFQVVKSTSFNLEEVVLRVSRVDIDEGISF